ncbi:DUF1501 domain-containing protein [Bythopirellula goksoeyrii]|uniref:Sulfatase n=1 Tax=Bythopirellula goksoeyrii TaxID=1400387 RepID=A0A5B9Q6R8_9BACT|nr:DUF1501 domain-containing protein [Bythopirellula goksoeyrii]QEG33400.1 hypothetical protein Pr1d_06630 [Bythopirellula goksoeyrii]
MRKRSLLDEARLASLEYASRRQFLVDCAAGLGAVWCGADHGAFGAESSFPQHSSNEPLSRTAPHFAPAAKRVIFLHMVGAPSQLDLFDFKPELRRHDGLPCPQEFLEGKRFAFLKGTPNMLGPQYPFKQYGESGAWVSDRLPHFAEHVDRVCFVKSMQTDQFNHGPAQLMVHTGQARMGYPSMGSWVAWGLGTENQNLPGFIVLMSGGSAPRVGKALWSSGMLPSVYQGVQCRSQGDPLLNIANPEGVSRDLRRTALDSLSRLNQESYQAFGNPETLTRIAQYELAFRMQMEVPGVMDIADEPEHIHQLYGTEPGKESFANNCLLARRLAERGVRFIQLYDWGWDSHGTSSETAINLGFQDKCREVDRPMSALLTDLSQRGMLEDTLVIWSGEFGRTPMRETKVGVESPYLGRDHNPEAFTLWAAGGGIKPGITFGETDPMGYSVVENPVLLRDFHATILHQLGLDHDRLHYPYQGLNQKLTGVKPAKVVADILA